MRTKMLLAALIALLCVANAQAGLNTLVVYTPPHGGTYAIGDTIRLFARSDARAAQYLFSLDRVTGAGLEPVNQRYWATGYTYNIDTTALQLTAGEYQLSVSVREGTGRETLRRTMLFTVTAPALTPCQLIEGMTYTNATAVDTPVVDLGCPGFLCSGLTSVLTAGFSMNTPAYAPNLSSFTFSGGNVSVVAKQYWITSSLGSGYVLENAPLAGTYTCSGSTITYSASGNGTLYGASGLVSLLGGAAVPLTSAGTLTINGNNTLTSGGATFQ